MKANLRKSTEPGSRILNLRPEGLNEIAMLKGVIKLLSRGGPFQIAALPRGNNSLDLVLMPGDSL